MQPNRQTVSLARFVLFALVAAWLLGESRAAIGSLAVLAFLYFGLLRPGWRLAGAVNAMGRGGRC